ncbi:MAG TPA: hypothetical protein VKF83_13015 [Stellaceae bacterium]|nr:hypothetical protein [Stellaceae bacterium]
MDTERSKQQPKEKTSDHHNEGEGNKTAARQYNEAQRQFVRSGKVDKQANAAKRALDSAERSEIEDAELVGKSHAAGEDRSVKKH